MTKDTLRADPWSLPARALARRIRRRGLTAVEAVESHLARIAQRNPALNAVVSLDVERARRSAEAADAALRRGEPCGPLHGVPITLKDGHDVAGLRTTVGAPPLDRIAETDGTVAARLRAAGANIVGHTNVAAWLGDPLQTTNPIFGRTANPWDPERSAGGSSGGAAAAVAGGMTPFEIGSDLAGSLRLPAHFCGLYGLKPTEHRVPMTGFFRTPGVPRPVRIMSCLGPIARDLDDLELALRIVSGPDGEDGDVPPVPLAAAPRRGLQDLRMAIAVSLPGSATGTSGRQMVEQVAAGASNAGARVEPRLPDIDWDGLDRLFGDLAAAITGIFSPGARLRDEQRTLAWYFEALDRRDRYARQWHAWFEQVDALILPAAAAGAFRHRESGANIEVDGNDVSYWAFARPLCFSNLAGLPSLVVPAGRDGEGLPVGVQIVGPRWSDLTLVRIARALERAGALPGFTWPPEPGTAR